MTLEDRMEEALGLLQGLSGDLVRHDYDFASALQDTAQTIHDRLEDETWADGIAERKGAVNGRSMRSVHDHSRV